MGREDSDARFSSLVENMEQEGFMGACAVGLWGIENYSHEPFIGECKRYPSLVPIAGINPDCVDSIFEELEQVKRLGYRGIKIHPRFSQFTNRIDQLEEVFICAAKLNLTIFFCTYMHCVLKDYPDIDPFYSLVALLRKSPEARVILVHGGDVQLLKYAELVRFNPNLLLDLSMTIMKYKGSSLDADIRFLFEHFDRRICIGTDHPENSHSSVRRRFTHFADGLTQIKQENIAFRNLANFLSIL
ncbi:MAG: amidohydrolase family protein [Chromatiaceae bacterium]|nr:amidohydrolase family protein [Chromatiaceae bacterium]